MCSSDLTVPNHHDNITNEYTGVGGCFGVLVGFIRFVIGVICSMGGIGSDVYSGV